MLLIHGPTISQFSMVRSAFTWGSWSSYSAECPGCLTFLCKEVQIESDSVLLHQETFNRETQLVTQVITATVRGQSEEIRTGTSLTEFTDNSVQIARRFSPVFQVAADLIDHDLSALTSLLQTGSPTRAQLRGLQQTVQFAQQTPRAGAIF
eukprot:5280006-Amphidinium_carterae.2